MAISYQKNSDNIVTLTMDMHGRSANVINDEFGAALQNVLAKLQSEAELTGVILTSAKKTFMAGGDRRYHRSSFLGRLSHPLQKIKDDYRKRKKEGNH